jgi:hypothetical protein
MYDLGDRHGNCTSHGFLYQAGVFTTIDFPTAADSWLWSINNNGVVGGSYEPTGVPMGPG